MTRHVAFIRNVMIGRANLHSEVLLDIFTRAGAAAPRSHLATGNVSFDWDGTDMATLVAATQRGIEHTMGRFEPIFVRGISELREAVEAQIFRSPPIDDVGHRCVTFTNTDGHLEYPIVSPRKDAYIYASRGTDVLSVTRLVGGRGGNVNRMVEKLLSCPATTRNWNTIERIVKLHESIPR